ncbi:cupin domain-containing protein [Sphingomonas populi]|uniref:Cupin domain-containing protein n=1 Tax=Sphingomonas populi TaxID=2484750 RepID=A0A4Q6XW41_9SPHN|nr:cupin domain-containing protein [Sphingomonas populi]RZF60666.1 cupin domain-containing protein [Sphingomonas populi]
MNPIRRIVTGHDASGKSVYLDVGEPPQKHHRTAPPVEFVEIWSTSQVPAPIFPVEPAEPNDRLPLRIPPDKGGTVIRILDIHPGHLDNIVPRDDGRHPSMHRTETIDYGIMIEGEITMILDDAAEVTLRPGDIVIQRGTDHAWENRSGKVARIAFVLIDGFFDGALADQLKDVKLMNTTIPQRGDQH